MKWSQSTIGEAVELSRSRVNPVNYSALPFVGMEHIEPHTSRLLGIGSASDVKSSVGHFFPGDVLYGRLRPYLNKVCVPKFEGLCSSEFLVLKPRSGVNPHFIKHRLVSMEFVRYANSVTAGTHRPRVSFDQISDFALPLPDLEVQVAIVDEIEKHFTRVEAATSLLRRCCTNLARYEISVWKAAIKGDLIGSNSSTWPRMRIEDLAVVGSGATPKKGRKDYYENGNVPWVTSRMLNDPLVRHPSAYVTEKALKETALRIWPEGTLLVAMYGEGKTRGKCSELLFPSTTNQACAAIVLRDEHRRLQPFLKLFLTASYEESRRLASGGVQPNLSLGLVKSIEVPIPPEDEQSDILEEVDRRLSVVQALKEVAQANLGRATRLRQAILASAFSGNLSLSGLPEFAGGSA